MISRPFSVGYRRSAAISSSSGYFFVIGMISSRRFRSGALIDTARFGRRSSFASASTPGMIPEVETVIRFAAMFM